MRARQASALSSEFCTIQVLKGPKNLLALRNSGVSAFQRLYCMAVNSDGRYRCQNIDISDTGVTATGIDI